MICPWRNMVMCACCRAFQIVKGQIQNEEQVEKDIQRLQDFIGSSKGSIWDSLKHNLTNVKRYERICGVL